MDRVALVGYNPRVGHGLATKPPPTTKDHESTITVMSGAKKKINYLAALLKMTEYIHFYSYFYTYLI